jgi:hypothetical protein
MGKLSKCKCENCGVNVEFDASELVPGEVRRGPCPDCGVDMDFYRESQSGIKPEDFNRNIKHPTTFGRFQNEGEIFRGRNKKTASEDAPLTLAFSTIIAFGTLLWFIIMLVKWIHLIGQDISDAAELYGTLFFWGAGVPLLSIVYDQLAGIICGKHKFIIKARWFLDVCNG